MSGCYCGQAGSQFCESCPLEDNCHNSYNISHKEHIVEDPADYERFIKDLEEEKQQFQNILYANKEEK